MTEFIEFWKLLLIDPKLFFKKEFNQNKIKYFEIAIVIFGIGYGIDRIDTQFVKFDLKGDIDKLDFLNNWFAYWSFSVIGGILGGYIVYLFGGWFYNVRIKWSGGTDNLKTARNLYLYSNVFTSFIIVLISIILTFKESIPYDPYSEFGLFELFYIPILLFFIFYSIHISYSGVISITNVKNSKAIIWFLILPIIYYLFVYSALAFLLLNYFNE